MRWDKNYVLEAAKKNQIVAGFNVFGYEDALAVINAAERANAPTMLMVNRDARRAMDLKHWASLLQSMADESTVPVAVHLDHSDDVHEVRYAINLGFTSVMYDGSKLPFAQNLANTKMLALEAHENGVYIEGELGAVPYDDMGETLIKLTDPNEAKGLQDNTELDWLAVSVGNIHRLAHRTTPIEFDKLEEIEEECSLPLVIHGSSGISKEDVEKLTKHSVGKMNFGTSLRKTFGMSIKEYIQLHPEEFDRQKMMRGGIKEVEEVAYQILKSVTQ